MTDQTTGLPAGSTDVAVNAEDEVTSYTNAQGRLTLCIPNCGKIKPNHQPSPGPIGNTVGIVVPQTSPNASGAGNSAPTPRPTEAEEGWWSSWGSDLTHGLLDVVGLIPLAGELADGLNGLIYLAEGDKVNAGLSFAMMLPIGGQAATAAKWGKKGVDAAEEAASRAAKEKAEREAKEEAKDGGWIDAEKKVTTQLEKKVQKQMENRGWDQDSINSTIENPNKTVVTRDTRWNSDGTRRNDPATAYIRKDGHYVVRNDNDGSIVQISNRNKAEWKSPFE